MPVAGQTMPAGQAFLAGKYGAKVVLPTLVQGTSPGLWRSNLLSEKRVAKPRVGQAIDGTVCYDF